MTLAQRVVSDYTPEIKSIFGCDAERATTLLVDCEARSYVEGRTFNLVQVLKVYGHLAGKQVRRSISLCDMLEAEVAHDDETYRTIGEARGVMTLQDLEEIRTEPIYVYRPGQRKICKTVPKPALPH